MIMTDMAPIVPIDQAARVAKIDRYGELQRRIDLFAPVKAEHKALGDEIESWYESSPPDQPVIAEGHLYLIKLSAREFQRKITNMKRVRRLLGAEVFLSVVAVALKHIDKLIPETEHHRFLTKDRTGGRELTPVLRVEPQQLPAA